MKVERELEKLFSFDSLKKEIKKKLLIGGMTEKAVNDVIDLITLEEETKASVADDIRKAVATYQGQATLGKIIHIVLHEGRRPLSYFKNEIPRISRFQQKFSDTRDNIYLDKMIDIVSGVRDNAIIFSDLFKRLDPLSTGNRAKKKLLNIKNEIMKTLDVFRHEMKINNISFEINSGDDVVLLAWSQDIQAVFANLIDNSIFWLKEVTHDRKIVINIIDNNGNLDFIDFRDTGPGIECSLIKDDVIFEPEFSTKPDGTGIGLAIAGEASARNSLELNVLDSAAGAYFRLQVKDVNND